MFTEEAKAVMRQIRAKSDGYLAQAQKLNPPTGHIAVGGMHIDAFARGEALATFLRHIGSGSTVEEAACEGKAEARRIIAHWNATRAGDYQVHIWEGRADADVNHATRLLAGVYLWQHT